MPEQTFSEKINRIKNQLEFLSHRRKTDTAYWEASKIAAELKSLFPTSNNIRLDIKLLEDYSFKSSDKRKSEAIEEFKKDTLFDILPIANRGERPSDLE